MKNTTPVRTMALAASMPNSALTWPTAAAGESRDEIRAAPGQRRQNATQGSVHGALFIAL